MTAEETHVRNIENGLRAIRMGVKAPKDTLAPISLNQLKKLNEGLYDDYIKKYKTAVEEYNKSKKDDTK
jgi:hypothetical protein